LTKDLHEYPLTDKTVHLCVDMQRIFSAEGPWPTPWMERVLPVVTELAGRFPERTVFTRFVTPNKANDMPGMWQRYYAKWKEATREHLNPDLLELLPPLARLCPPATVVNKTRYSAIIAAHDFTAGWPQEGMRWIGTVALTKLKEEKRFRRQRHPAEAATSQ